MNFKAAASLTGSLLARKGAAYPASYSAPAASPDSSDDASDGSAPRAYNDPRVIASAPPTTDTSTALSTLGRKGEQLQDGRYAPSPAASEPLVAKPSADPTPEVDSTPAFDPTPADHTSPLVDPTPAVDTTPVVDTVPAATYTPAPVADTGMAATEDIGLPQALDKMGRVRLSVRLDPDRYLRVKMASARTRWSAQDIVIAALDRYLGGKPESGSDNGDDGTGGTRGNLN
jgi:hypothetical protein